MNSANAKAAKKASEYRQPIIEEVTKLLPHMPTVELVALLFKARAAKRKYPFVQDLDNAIGRHARKGLPRQLRIPKQVLFGDGQP